jgi:hypothetical protein
MSMQSDRGQGADYPKAVDMALSGPMESKVCEMGCGRSFVRPVPASAPKGLKYCPGCLKLNEFSREKQAIDFASREASARRGVM